MVPEEGFPLAAKAPYASATQSAEADRTNGLFPAGFGSIADTDHAFLRDQ
jgi:hypothetical protein